MLLETLEAAERNDRMEPLLVCKGCGRTAPWAEVADVTCKCGAETVQRDYALSAPERGLRLYVTALSHLSAFHYDGRGLEAREACTTCTDCFVCKQPLNTQDCAWDEVPLEGLLEKTGLTQQYVYLHPDCCPAYEEWRAGYLERAQEDEARRAEEAERREYCQENALCLECEKPLSLIDRFVGRLRHYNCSVKAQASKSSQAKKAQKKNK